MESARMVRIKLSFEVVITHRHSLRFKVNLLSSFSYFTRNFREAFIRESNDLFGPTFFARIAKRIFRRQAPMFNVFNVTEFSVSGLCPTNHFVMVIRDRDPESRNMTASRVFSPRFIRRRFRPFIGCIVAMCPYPISFLSANCRTIRVIFHLTNPEFVRSTNHSNPLSNVNRRLRSQGRNIRVLLTPGEGLMMANCKVKVLPRIRVRDPILQD